jgi:ribosome-interacting GTPase 1
MPANLPPQYYETEKKLREAKDPAEKIEIIEELLAIMPKHKGTDHLRADLRSKIAKLTQSMGKKATLHRTKTVIPKEGAAQLAVIGMPNAGKSQLVASTTNASPTVADYPFTTQTATPGMMPFENIHIQLIDTPPIAPQSYPFWLSHMLRRADALLIVIDLSDEPLKQMETILEELKDMRISLDSPNAREEEGIISHKKAIILANKRDKENTKQNLAALQNKYGDKLPIMAVSAREKIGLEEIKPKIYQMLGVIRVYTKAPGEKPILSDPIILPMGSTLEEAAAAVHKDFLARLKYARVWGSGKHDGIMVKRDHVLQEGDIIELHV